MLHRTWEDEPTTETVKDEYAEAIDIFPALHKYKLEHNETNLKKLLVEVTEFCRAIYTSTQNINERQLYLDTIEKLRQK